MHIMFIMFVWLEVCLKGTFLLYQLTCNNDEIALDWLFIKTHTVEKMNIHMNLIAYYNSVGIKVK